MCEYCKEEKGFPIAVIENDNDLCGEPSAELNITKDGKLNCDISTFCDDDYYNDSINVQVQFNFCPMCGKKLKRKKS